jgi:uncharacterized protein (DUF2147 family)
MKSILTLSVVVAALFSGSAALAQQTSPVGLWRTISDDTGKQKSLVRITEANGVFSGKVEKLFREPGEEPNPLCDKCDGELKGKPALGMTILTGIKQDGKAYDGGKILDPNNGKIYSAKLTLTDGGKKLEMRGYIGMPMMGRTQTWLREE